MPVYHIGKYKAGIQPICYICPVMNRVFVFFVLAFLLFSVAAETFSALLVPGKDHIVLTESDETEKGAQKEKEEKSNDKFSGNYITLSGLRTGSITQVEFAEPRAPHPTHHGYYLLPEQPPRL